MKKLLTAIFAFFYLGLSSGATVHLHYCMGRLVDWSLQHDKKSDHCSKCRMKKDQSNKGCCKNENKVIKITTDQKADINLYQAFQVSFVTLASPVIELTVPFDSSLTDKIAVSHAPPLNGDTGIYLLNCVFRI